MTTGKPRKLKRWELYKKEFQIPELRIDEPVGNYPRQSTKRQKTKNKQSFQKQTQDAIDDLMKRGWLRELIIVYDQDMGTSAVRVLEDREAMNQMLGDIRGKRIRTVRAAEVDRLFWDEDRIDSNIFIKVCKEADCLVITDRMIYDFSIPRHVDYFRDEVDRAWKFYESQILIRANEMQDRARSKGLYAGGPPPIGFIIDKNPRSETFMKYIPYSPHAERSHEVFQWLYDCGGILGILKRKLDSLPFVWPVEEAWVREQKAFWTNLEKVCGTELDEDGNLIPIGYRISEHGLTCFLQNRSYRGDWLYDGDWIENNHEAIVPKDLFDFAQSCFDKRATTEIANYHTTTNSVIYDILSPEPIPGEKRYIIQHLGKNYRAISLNGMKRSIRATISIEDIEQVFLQKFTERLQDTQRFENYEEKVSKDDENKEIDKRKRNLQDVIIELTDRIDGIFLTLQSKKLKPDEREEYIEERRKLMKRREAAQKELKIPSPIQVYLKYKDLILKMGHYWERYPFEDRQALVALLVRQVYLEPLSHHFMRLTIVWKEFPSDTAIIWRRHANSMGWEEEEDQTLRDMYPTKAPQEILHALRRRTWASINSRAAELRITRHVKIGGIVRKDLSIEDVEIAEKYGISMDMLGKSLFAKWVFLFRASKQSWGL